jgi:protein TonB
MGLVLLIEALLLLMLLTLGAEKRTGTEKKDLVVLDFLPEEPAAEAPEESPARPEEAAEQPSPPERPAEETPPREAAEPPPAQPLQPPPVQAPVPSPRPVPAVEGRSADAVPRPAPAPPKRVYGPPDTGRPAHLRDTERVGTAPNGQPLYAAAWYEKPRREALGAYLSTARGPGWGLIACRTAPGYRVEDCVGLAEYPEGSQIMRAVLAAAWEFKVRPPRLGGQPLVGSWVRIRIDYGIERQ